MEQVHAAIDTVMATGKVVAFAVVSVYGEGEGHEVTQASGIELIRGGLEAWNKHGMGHAAVAA
jgi:arginase